MSKFLADRLVPLTPQTYLEYTGARVLVVVVGAVAVSYGANASTNCYLKLLLEFFFQISKPGVVIVCGNGPLSCGE